MASRNSAGRSDEDESTAESTSHNNASSDEAVGAIADKVDILVNALHDTNSNLRSVDKLLDTYRTLNEQQAVMVDRVRDDTHRMAVRSGSHRNSSSFSEDSAAASPLRHRASLQKMKERHLTNSEVRKLMGTPHGSSSPMHARFASSLSDVHASSVRDQTPSGTGVPRPASAHLAIEADYEPSRAPEKVKNETTLHSVHQAIRELASEQVRIRHDLDSEIRSRRSALSASELNLRDLVDRFRRDERGDGDADVDADMRNSSAIEKQLNEIGQELRSARNKRNTPVASPTRGMLNAQPAVSHSLKSAIDAHHKSAMGDGTSMYQPALATIPPGAYAALGAGLIQPAIGNPLSVPHAHTPAHSHPSAPTDSSNEAFLKSKVTQLERQKIEMEHELDGLKRKLVHAENARQTLQKQLDESQSQLHASERDRTRARAELEDVRHDAERKTQKLAKEAEEEREEERRKAERELNALRQRLEQQTATSTAELSDARRELDRLTFAHKHATEQIASLRADLDTRDRAATKQSNEIQERDSRCNALERQFNELQIRLASTLDELRQSREAHSRLASQLHSSEHAHADALRTETEARQRMHERVKQLKASLNKTEKDLEDARHRAAEMARKCDAAAAENDQLRRQVAHIHITFEQLKREFDNLLTIRGKQEEAIRAKEDEMDRLRTERADLEAAIELARRSQENAEQQLLALQHETNALRADRVRSVEQLAALEAARRVQDEQLKAYQSDSKQALTERAQLVTANQQLTLANNELRIEQAQLAGREKTVRAELAALTVALDEEKAKHNAALLRLSREIEDIKDHEKHALQEAAHTLKDQENVLFNERNKLNLELSDARKHKDALQARCDQQQVELMNLHEKLTKSEQIALTTQNKCLKLKERQKQTSMQEREVQELERSKAERIATLERERNLLMDTAMADLNWLLARTELQSDAHGEQSMRSEHADVSLWLIDFKTKLNLLLTELERLRETRERRERFPLDDDTGYTSASPRHSLSFSASLNDPFSAASGLSAHDAAAYNESKRKLEAIENDIGLLLRNLEQNGRKARDSKLNRPNCHVSGTHRSSNGTSSPVHDTLSQYSRLSVDSLSPTALLEKQRIVNRCSRLQNSVRALRDDLAVSAPLDVATDPTSAHTRQPLASALGNSQAYSHRLSAGTN